MRRLFRDEFPPLLRAVDPLLRNLNPLLTGLNLYRREVTSFFANVAASANGELPNENARGEKVHFLRAMGPLNPESLTTLVNRLTINRNSAYSPPQWAKGLASGLPGFDTRQCSSGITASLNPESATSTALKERTKTGDPKEAEDFFNRLKKYAFVEQTSTGSIPAPACIQQAPFAPIYGSGPATQYQHTFEQTGPANSG